MDQDLLIGICRRFLAPANIEVVIREPYIPYIPEKWNGILVLGEAQNLSNTYKSYVDELESMTELERFFRLKNPENLGIMPWDNGSLKLAIESAFQESASETAVSNAVVWSQIKSNGAQNRNPGKELEKYASEFWSELLHTLNPKHIVASGRVAHRVIDKTKWGGRITKLIHPSAIRYIKAGLRENEMIERHPIIKKVIDLHADWVELHRFAKIRFAYNTMEIVKEIQIK